MAAAKARGVRLGNPQAFKGKIYREAGRAAQERAQAFARTLGPTLRDLKVRGLSASAMARELEALGIRTARGGSWTAQSVLNVLERIQGH